MSKLQGWITDRPLWILGGVALISLLAASQLVERGEDGFSSRLHVDPSVERVVPDAGEDRLFYERVRRMFGSDETLVVALAADDVFTPDVLERMLRLTERLEAIEGVHNVLSLSTALDIRSVEGDLEIEPFLTQVPETPEGLAALRQRALDNPIYAGNLVSADGRATALVVHLLEMSERQFAERGIEAQVRNAVDEVRGGVEAWVTGPLLLRAATSRILITDLQRILPLALLFALGIAWLSFRSVVGVLLPVATIAIALLWTLGAMAAAGRALNLVTTILPPLLLTIGFTYVVHVLAEYEAMLRRGAQDAREASRRALAHVALPVALTGLTTCAGFLSLLASPISAIREFGFFATAGVLVSVAISLGFAPAVLALRRVRPHASTETHGRIERLAEATARFDLRHRRWLLAAGFGLALVSAWGVTRIHVSNDLVSNLPPDSPARVHFEAINERLGGSNPLYVVLESSGRDAFKAPANLRTVHELQGWLEAQPEVGSTTSLVEYLMLINRGFHDDDPAFLKIPESQALITQLLFFGANDEIGSFVDSRYQTLSILVRATSVDSGSLGGLVDRIEARLAELPEHLEGTVSGNAVLLARSADALARGQMQSLGLAFLAIYLILALLFTSLRVGFLALLPNLLPVLLFFGTLGLLGIPLGAVTGLVACIVLGIAVDDTIHYLSRFNTEARRAADERTGTIEALRGVARPVTLTTAALCLGFGVLVLSQLRSQSHFGALAAFTLGAAWLVDVTFTPALCSSIRIVGLWDVLTLDLGRDPQRSIPIFEGLSRAQARIVALMMQLRTLPKDHSLFRVGEAGDEMYVVIEGELEASLPREPERIVLSRMGRGECVGEVALFHGKRTADVTTLSEVRLLRLTDSDLERLRRRYPRIGARIYRNLSRILAGRVARDTELLR